MRKAVLIIVLTALVALGVNGSAGLTADMSKDIATAADPQSIGVSFPSGSWTSGIEVQNLSSTNSATVIVEFYSEAGGPPVYTAPGAVVPANRSATFYTPNLSGLPSGRFAAVISSDQPVAAVANQVNYSGSGLADSYLGMATGALSVDIPLVYRGHSSWFSLIAVQNTSSTAPASVNVDFYPAGSATYVLRKQAVIPPNSAGYFDTSTSEYAGLGSPFLGSASVTSNQNVVAIVNNTKEAGGSSVLSTFGGSTSGAMSFIAPLVYKNYSPNTTQGWTSGITVRNKAATATNVRMTFKPTNGSSTYVKDLTVQGNSSETFYMPNYSDIPSGLFGSATIESLTAGNQISVLVNATKYQSGVATGYAAFPAGSGTTKIVAPLAYKSYSNGFMTGIQVYNMGSSDDTVTVRYSGQVPATGVSNTWTKTMLVPSLGTNNFYMYNYGDIPDGSYGSVIIESTQPIVAVVNTTKYPANIALSYTAINQ